MGPHYFKCSQYCHDCLQVKVQSAAYRDIPENVGDITLGGTMMIKWESVSTSCTEDVAQIRITLVTVEDVREFASVMTGSLVSLDM